jgi:hypothetical protein
LHVSCKLQWINSSFVPDSKYTRAASDEHLANQVLPSSFVPADLRSTKLHATCTYDKERYHAFTRGEVTTGKVLTRPAA